MKIGIIIAMDIEYRKMLDTLGGKPEGRIGANEVVLWQCGIGKVNAAVGTMQLIQQHRPDCILSTGLAGGIDDSLKVMDVVVGSQTAYHDVDCGMGNAPGQVQGLPLRFDAHPDLLRVAAEVGKESDLHVRQGLMCTGDQFITDRARQAAIKALFPDGLACEMESAAIAHTCYLQQVPFLSIRVISDTPGNTDDHQQQWDAFLNSMTDRSFRFVRSFLEHL
jgi:adenosylhomocysteine nucleosidase